LPRAQPVAIGEASPVWVDGRLPALKPALLPPLDQTVRRLRLQIHCIGLL
jgi:hypothetical protein